MAPFGHTPLGKTGLFIPKLVADKSTGRPLPFATVLEAFRRREDPKLFDGNLALQLGYRYIDNTPQEILEAAREMLDRMDGTHRHDAEAAELQRMYSAAKPADHWCAKNVTPVGDSFLRVHRDLLRTRSSGSADGRAGATARRA
jgi:hypothetical protein